MFFRFRFDVTTYWGAKFATSFFFFLKTTHIILTLNPVMRARQTAGSRSTFITEYPRKSTGHDCAHMTRLGAKAFLSLLMLRKPACGNVKTLVKPLDSTSGGKRT